MNDRLLLLPDQGPAIELHAEAGLTEERLRKLLLQHPQLLASAPGSPLDEAGSLPVPWQMANFGGGGTVSSRRLLDLLFIDAEAIPMFVATVRASESRLRHEAIGEMLEQASEVAMQVTADALRARFHAGCDARGDAASDLLDRCIGPEQSEVNFWPQVAANLRTGRLRLALVADEIPGSFQRSLEFLNRQFSAVELIAVELRLFSGDGMVAVAPRVWDGNPMTPATPRPSPPASPTTNLTGRSAPPDPFGAGIIKSAPAMPGAVPVERSLPRRWDESAFFSELAAHHSDDVVTAARRVLAWTRVQPGRVLFEQSGPHGAFIPVLATNGAEQRLFSVRTDGTMQLACLADASAPRQAELLRRLNSVGGYEIQVIPGGTGPELSLAVISERSRLIRFLAAFEWFVGDTTSLNA